jgi:hypothetical protein
MWEFNCSIHKLSDDAVYMYQCPITWVDYEVQFAGMEWGEQEMTTAYLKALPRYSPETTEEHRNSTVRILGASSENGTG